MDHQDWEPVVLCKSNAEIRKSQKKRNGVQPGQNVEKRYGGGQNQQTSVGRIDDNYDDVKAPNKVSSLLKTQIRNGRTAKGWTQKKFAQECNLTLNVVKDYENGKVVPNHSVLNKMRRVLGCKLSKT